MSKENKVGSGAFATVFDSGDGYVLKRYAREDIKDASKEIDALKLIKKNRKEFKQYCLEHLGFYDKSSIITLKEWSLEENGPVIKMKKYTCTLQDLLEEYFKKTGSTMDIELTRHIHFKLMFGLAELQFSEIIHGDLKPENIVLSLDSKKLGSKKKLKSAIEVVAFITNLEKKQGGIDSIKKSLNIKIIDFNKCVHLHSSLKSTNIQTIYYTPPEIILGDMFYTNSVDIWTAGCILYEMLTMKHLFNIWNKDNICHNLDNESNLSSSRSETSESSSSYSSEYYDDDKFVHLALMHYYDRLLGCYPKELLCDTMKNTDTYFCNGIIIGGTNKESCKTESVFAFNSFFNMVLSTTFKYNYKERLTIEEYFSLYLRTSNNVF